MFGGYIGNIIRPKRGERKMARPSKSAKVLHPRSQTKDEIKARVEVEDELKGNLDSLEPSSRLNANQRKIFRQIVEGLKASRILGNLDIHSLEMGCITIDRLQAIEKEINRDFSNIYNRELMAAKGKYSTDFFKFCQEFCLSPQSRAKMGIALTAKKAEETDPLLKVLKGKSG